MAWIPVHASTDIRKILGNLITFFEANQVGALAWASPLRPLAPLKIYKTAEFDEKVDFPHLGVVKRRTTTEDLDEGLAIKYDLTFVIEILATHSEATRSAARVQLQLDTDNYIYAFESMFLNIPQATLFANVTGASNLYRTITSSEPIEGASGNDKSMNGVIINAVMQFQEDPR